MQTKLETLDAEHKALRDRATALIDQAAKEDRNLTPDEAEQCGRLKMDILKLTKEMEKEGFMLALDRATGGLATRSANTRTASAREETDDDVVLDSKRSMFDVLQRRGVRYANEVGADRMSLGKIIRAVAFGKRDGLSELEMRAMSEGTDSAGGFTVPEIVAAQFIDRLRPALVTQRAGAMIVPMTSDTLHLARVATGPTPLAWKVENAAINESAITLERVSLSAKTLPVLVKMSVELSEDSANIDTIIQQELGAALAGELDRVALRGSGVAPEPKGVLNQTGVTLQSTGAAGAALTYDPILDAGFAVLGNNVPPEKLKVILNARSAKSLAKLKNTPGDFLTPPAAFTAWGPPLMTNSIPSNLTVGASTDTSEVYVGDFSELLIGIRTSFRLEVSRQAGDATSSAFSNLQVWVRAYLRADIAIGHPEAFVVVLGVRP